MRKAKSLVRWTTTFGSCDCAVESWDVVRTCPAHGGYVAEAARTERSWEAFRIYDTETGLYSLGGRAYSGTQRERFWGPRGTVWGTLQHVMAHLRWCGLTLDTLPRRYVLERAVFRGCV